MPIVRWLATVLRASIWLLVNLVVASALLLASAALFSRTDDDFRVPATVVRTIGAVWFYAAAYTWVVRGLLMRPPPEPSRRKVTGAEAARGMAGCVGTAALVALIWSVGGHLADWAVAGLTAGDPLHPARQVADRALVGLQTLAATPDAYLPRIVGGLVAFFVVMALLARLAGPPATPRPADTPAKASRRKDRGAAAARGAPPSRIPTPAGAAIERAHEGSHGAARAGRRREDGVLGELRYASNDDGWWARERSEAFPVRIEADEEGPSSAQLDLARALVQRSFEAQLRGADAARAAAQARGVGLPRFTIATASVGADRGADTPVTLHLRCEGDAQHEYMVRSTNRLQSFTPV